MVKQWSYWSLIKESKVRQGEQGKDPRDHSSSCREVRTRKVGGRERARGRCHRRRVVVAIVVVVTEGGEVERT
jgi:hypothetical protein